MERHNNDIALKFYVADKQQKYAKVGEKYQQKFNIKPQRISINRQWIKKIVEETGAEPQYAKIIQKEDFILVKLIFEKYQVESASIKKIVTSGSRKCTYNFDCTNVFTEFIKEMPTHHTQVNKRIVLVELLEYNLIKYSKPVVYYNFSTSETVKNLSEFKRKRLMQKANRFFVYLKELENNDDLDGIKENKEWINTKIRYFKRQNPALFENLKELE